MAKVLIIEDEKAIRKIYTTMFQTEGHKVLATDNGVEGYALAVKEQPQLILLDYRLPGITGLDVLKKLQAAPETQEIPVVIITNYIENINKEAVLEQGANKILLKYEISPRELLTETNKFLTRGG